MVRAWSGNELMKWMNFTLPLVSDDDSHRNGVEAPIRQDRIHAVQNVVVSLYTQRRRAAEGHPLHCRDLLIDNLATRAGERKLHRVAAYLRRQDGPMELGYRRMVIQTCKRPTRHGDLGRRPLDLVVGPQVRSGVAKEQVLRLNQHTADMLFNRLYLSQHIIPAVRGRRSRKLSFHPCVNG